MELEFKHAFCDEAEPVLDPADSLDDDDVGWGSYSRQWRSHYAVFVLGEPVAVAPGSRIRIELKQNRHTSGDVAAGDSSRSIFGVVERRLDSAAAIAGVRCRAKRVRRNKRNLPRKYRAYRFP